jgi:molecular chaperone GrpE
MTDERTEEPEAAVEETSEIPETNQHFDAVAAVAEMEAAMAAVEAEQHKQEPGGSDRYIELLESEIMELNALVETREAALAKAEARTERAQDEIEKAKARLTAESGKQLEIATRKVLVSFIEVLDELDRALNAARQEEGASELEVGVENVHRRFLTTLEGFGARRCPALGQPFDPAVHDALTTTPTPDPDQDGKVVAVIREGYTIVNGDSEELLRAASVVVGKARAQ